MIDIFTGAAAPLTHAGFEAAVAILGEPHDPALLQGVVTVLGAGDAFLPDRRPQLRFERHLFHQRTGGRFSAASPDLSDPVPGGNGSGPDEYQRLKRAMLLDRRAALESGRWGLGGVPGFQARRIGYADVDTMIAHFKESERAQLEGLAASIVAAPPLHDAYRDRDWIRLAFFFEGPAYAVTGSDRELATTYASLLRDAGEAQASHIGLPGGIGGEPRPTPTLGRVAFVPASRTVSLVDTSSEKEPVTG